MLQDLCPFSSHHLHPYIWVGSQACLIYSLAQFPVQASRGSLVFLRLLLSVSGGSNGTMHVPLCLVYIYIAIHIPMHCVLSYTYIHCPGGSNGAEHLPLQLIHIHLHFTYTNTYTYIYTYIPYHTYTHPAQLRGFLATWFDPESFTHSAYVKIFATFATKGAVSEHFATKSDIIQCFLTKIEIF